MYFDAGRGEARHDHGDLSGAGAVPREHRDPRRGDGVHPRPVVQEVARIGSRPCARSFVSAPSSPKHTAVSIGDLAYGLGLIGRVTRIWPRSTSHEFP